MGVTGGVAAYKAAALARLLTAEGADVTCVMTESATRFLGPDTLAALTGRPVHTSLWERPGEVLHVRLAHETEIAVVAPATANAIAKLANGLADDLLTSTLLEYSGPLVIAPAMHSGMWRSPATVSNVEALAARGVGFVGPEEGPLAHGDEGIGRMAEPEVILAAVGDTTQEGGVLKSRHLVVTAGATHEPIDPVRFLGNRSSGRMGVAVAEAIRDRGARVTLILGPGSVRPPLGVTVIAVQTAEEMHEAALGAFEDADGLVMAAAVADFRPKVAAPEKLKKDQGPPELLLEPTPDILAELGERKGSRILVGFAAETQDVEAAGREKLARKGCDLVVANLVGREGTGFASDTNEAAILARDGRDVPLRTWTKAALAAEVADRVAALLGGSGTAPARSGSAS